MLNCEYSLMTDMFLTTCEQSSEIGSKLKIAKFNFLWLLWYMISAKYAKDVEFSIPAALYAAYHSATCKTTHHKSATVPLALNTITCRNLDINREVGKIIVILWRQNLHFILCDDFAITSHLAINNQKLTS